MRELWNEEELFYRQVHPKHQTGDKPNSQAFFPTPKDDDRLSVDDAHQTTAEAAWNHFTQDLGFDSSGTWAISKSEIDETGDLKLVPAPKPENQAHYLIDYSAVSSKSQKKRRAQTLAIHASKRGCLYSP